MFSAWYQLVPSDLWQEEPRVLIGLLSIGDEGTSQVALRRKLKIRQSHLSKLLTKLRRWELIAEEQSEEDGRVRLYRTTPGAAALSSYIEQSLTRVLEEEGYTGNRQ
jgi:DNA-binding MarR family transcriptional regulator